MSGDSGGGPERRRTARRAFRLLPKPAIDDCRACRWQAALRAAAGLEQEAYWLEQEEGEQNGYGYVEVRVYDKQGGRQLCSLVEARP